MFRTTQNIDTAFRQTRLVAMVAIVASAAISCASVLVSFRMVWRAQQQVYVLANGKALEAFALNGKDNVPVEARDHVQTFHQLFFDLDPDDALIRANIGRALYLADHSAKEHYDNLREKSYYANMIAGNVSQRIQVDSVVLDMSGHPYLFRCTAKLEITRATSTVQRSLVTEGRLRNIRRSDNNTHGFLIEQFRITENRDMEVNIRK